MKRFYFLIYIFIIFFSFNVSAAEMDVTNKIKANTSYTSGSYFGVTPAFVVVPNFYNVKTRYSGTLSLIEFYLYQNDWDWDYNTTYSITLYMATEDWRNHFMGPQVFRANTNGSIPSNSSNMYVQNTFRFISQKQIKFNFKTKDSTNMGPYIKFTLYSSNTTKTAFTGVSNWNLNRIVITPVSSGPTPAPVTPSPTVRPVTPTPQPNNQDIINNNTQNTQDIINNNNTNTQDIINNNSSNTQEIIDSNNSNTTDIIDNNNSNTQDIIDNQNTNTDKTNSLLGDCHKNLFNVFGYEPYTNARYTKTDRSSDQAVVLTANGNYTGGSFPLIYHLKLKANTSYHFQFDTANSVIGSASPYFYVYHSEPSSSANLIYYTGGYNGFVFTTPNYEYEDYYIQLYVSGTQTEGTKIVLQRPMLFEGTYHSNTYIPYGQEQCTSKLDDTTSAINDLNDTINNDNVDDKSSFFTNFDNNTHGLTGIITLPLSTIQNLANTSCTSLSIPIPYTNSHVNLPCMTQVYQTYIPSVYSIWQVVSFGIISYFICIDIFKMVKGFKDPNEDKIEVLDL